MGGVRVALDPTGFGGRRLATLKHSSWIAERAPLEHARDAVGAAELLLLLPPESPSRPRLGEEEAPGGEEEERVVKINKDKV